MASKEQGNKKGTKTLLMVVREKIEREKAERGEQDERAALSRIFIAELNKIAEEKREEKRKVEEERKRMEEEWKKNQEEVQKIKQAEEEASPEVAMDNNESIEIERDDEKSQQEIGATGYSLEQSVSAIFRKDNRSAFKAHMKHN